MAFTRRALLIGGATALLASPRASAARDPFADRARRSYAALQRYFHNPETSLYLEQYPREGGNDWSYVWPFSQAMLATQVMAGIGAEYRDDVADRYRGLEAYWNPGLDPVGYDSYVRPPLGHGGDLFYDDNEWNALGFVQRHYMTPGGDQAAMDRAAVVFDLVVSGWDTDPAHPCPGGVFWTQADWSSARNTISNGPGAELGLHLYLHTGDRHYLDWARRMYEWVRGCLLAPDGLYWDKIDLDGSIWKALFSYNQGVMVGAGVLLYRATGERVYLDQAVGTAARALEFLDGRYFTQPPRFHGIFFANLLQLHAVHPDPAYRAALEYYAGEARARFHDPATDLYRFRDTEPVTLLEQAAMTRMEGMLAWPADAYHLLT